MRIVVLCLVWGLLVIIPVSAQEPISPEQNLDLIWQHQRTQPDDFAVACMPLDNRAATVLWNANAEFPLASVSKVLIFIEYARRVDAGLMTMGETVQISELNRYDLPRTDRGAHDDFLDEYPGRTSLMLWDIAAEGMIRYSSNAASDYMLARMAPIDWGSLYAALNMRTLQPPHPLGMIPLLMNNHETGQPTLSDVPDLSRIQGLDLFASYVSDPDWRNAEIDYRTARRRTFPAWNIQAEILQSYTATGTAYDHINMMAAIYGEGGELSGDVKAMVREALRWTGYPHLQATYDEYGSKLGFYSGGTLTLVAYGQAYGGEPIISVIFLRNVNRSLYRDLLRQDTIGDMAHWLNLNGCGVLNDRLLQ